MATMEGIKMENYGIVFTLMYFDGEEYGLATQLLADGDLPLFFDGVGYLHDVQRETTGTLDIYRDTRIPMEVVLDAMIGLLESLPQSRF